MSLSMLAKSLIFALLALTSGWVGREYAIPVANYLTDVRDITARDARISKRSIAYRIPDQAPLGFVFSQPVTLAKILVHPAVSEDVRDLEQGFVYGIRLRWIDANGEEISVHDTYLQADSPDTVFASGEVWRFFRTRPELVAEQDNLLVESPEPAAQLEIEVFDIDRGIIGIDVRVFEQRIYLGAQSLSAFRRLSEESRDLLTQPNAFPADMLTQQEQLNLGRNHWRAVGPLGLDGRDYTMLVLYEALREDVMQDGVFDSGGAQ
ncbi:MAG: hypothetical protein AAGL68_00310 [Pseudomonadota bacterium]